VSLVADVVSLLTVEELEKHIVEGEPLAVLDVREPDERSCAAIGLPMDVVDLHVPLGEVTVRFPEIVAAVSNRPLVVYCHHGQRSMVAATWLARRGVCDVHNLEGGIDAWSTRVDPKVRRY
jgi:rhodanese-related sulfurtransferase